MGLLTELPIRQVFKHARRLRFGEESPWWLPEAVDERIFTRLFDGVRGLLRDINADPRHEIRARFDEWATSLAGRLEQEPAPGPAPEATWDEEYRRRVFAWDEGTSSG